LVKRREVKPVRKPFPPLAEKRKGGLSPYFAGGKNNLTVMWKKKGRGNRNRSLLEWGEGGGGDS